jgi:methionyl-tRNA formyltransferase
MAGDTMTGVTIIQLDDSLDTGPVLTAQAMDIDPDDDLGVLTDRLANMGAHLLNDSLAKYIDGSSSPVPQSDEGMTYAHKITREDRGLSVDATPEAFLNHVRALSPNPGATIGIDGSSHKILKAKSSDHQLTAGSWEVVDQSVVIGLQDGAVEILLLQPPGKNPQFGPDWARGRRVSFGLVESG